jgi:hypothetical protein
VTTNVNLVYYIGFDNPSLIVAIKMLSTNQLPWQKVPQTTSTHVVLFSLKLINNTLSF